MFSIVPASPADIPDVAATLASAFSEEPVMGAMVTGPDKQARLDTVFRSILRLGPLRSGRVDLARRDSDGVLLGASVWDAPGAKSPLLAALRELPALIGAIGARGLASGYRVGYTLAMHRPSEPHWHLSHVGVTEQARGAGVGSALLRHRLEKIDAANDVAYLESSNERNRALYLRHGFVRIADLAGIPGVRPTGMWRPAVSDRRSGPIIAA